MKVIAALPIFFRLYGFHRRGGKQFSTAVRLASRAFDREFI